MSAFITPSPLARSTFTPAVAAAPAARPAVAGPVMAAATASTKKFEKMKLKWGTPGMLEEILKKDGKTPATNEEEAAVKADFSYKDFESAIGEYNYHFNVGDTVVGTVYGFDQVGAIVDIGAKASANCPSAEICMTPVDRAEEFVAMGDTREFEIISNEDENGQLKVSLRRIDTRRAWDRLAQMQAEDVTVFAEVLSVNRGGCLVKVENLRGFLPGSQMALPPPHDDLVGKKIPLKFIEVDQEKSRLILSNKRAMVEKQMKDIQAGSVVEGIVNSIKPYGLFVTIFGIPGLLHISQISHDHIEDVGKVLPVGTKIKCMVISQDKDKGRISLSTKTLEPEPGDMLKNPQAVYDRAEEMAARYHKRLEEERKAAADVANDIVSTLDMASLDDFSVEGSADPVEALLRN